MSKALTRYRRKGIISKTAFADNSRRIIKNFDDEYETLTEFVQRYINYVQKPLDYYTIPRWHNQPNYVEVWIEKDAMASSLASILRGQQVVIVPNRGWSSLTYITNNIERLIEHLESNTHQQVHILYCGDFDPSGMRMDSVIQQEINNPEHTFRNVDGDLEQLSSRCHFKRLAITEEQLVKYGLKNLTNPEADMEKLRRDDNRAWFIEKFGSLFQVQLDAMQSIHDFKDIVLDAVNEYFDNEIYEQNEEEEMPTDDEAKEIVKTQVKELWDDLNERYE